MSFLLLVGLSPLVFVGCGGSTEEASTTATATTPEPTVAVQTAAPGEVVSQFLDRVRRGGDDNSAALLLTKLAQQEMIRIGRPLQFPGSPDTDFRVGRIMPIPDQPDSVYVETFLSDAPVDGANEATTGSSYEVVWTLKKQNADWRISGFVLSQGDELDPLQIDFENGQQMEALLASMEDESSSEKR